jgi:putative exosortase-associated protein (TIGR04073 family)
MKKIVAGVLAVALCASMAMAQEEVKGSGAQNFKSMCENMGRGLVNAATCWMEVPRNLWLETTRNPYYGYVVGAMDGAFLTTARAFGGVTDFVTFGLTGPSIYSDNFPRHL